MKHGVAALVAAVSSASISVGVAMVFIPAGLMTAGLLGFVLLYVAAYLDARRVKQ